MGRTKWRYDAGGIIQKANEIINVASGKCLDVSGTDGHGNIGVHSCENWYDEYFYFRSRGKLIARGRLRNEKSSQCLDNGELVNEKSRRCLDVSGTDGTGNIQIHACKDRQDQMWSRPTFLCNGEYRSFFNKKSAQCLDVSGHDGRGGVATYNCEGLADQRLKFVTDKWTAPVAKWVMVGCNQNGKVSQWISNTVEYSSTVTVTVGVEVSASLEADLVFAKGTVSTKVSRHWPLRGRTVNQAQQESSLRARITTTKKPSQEVACGSYRWKQQRFCAAVFCGGVHN
eukprot:gene18424-biopygen12363